MILFLLILGLIISLGINIATFVIIYRLISRIDVYETWILEFKQSVVNTLTNMRNIDKQGIFATSMNDKGTFESDDQVGQIFKELLNLIETLNEKIE